MKKFCRYIMGNPEVGDCVASHTLTREIQVTDYPDFDPTTEEGRERFTLLACEMNFRNPALSHFVFKRGAEVLGEMYLTDEFEEAH